VWHYADVIGMAAVWLGSRLPSPTLRPYFRRRGLSWQPTLSERGLNMPKLLVN